MTSPLLDPPGDPTVRDTQAGSVRYAEQQYAHTTVQIDPMVCRVCGSPMAETHRLVSVAEDGVRTVVGEISRCPNCDRESWMFWSNMPAARAARARGRQVVP